MSEEAGWEEGEESPASPFPLESRRQRNPPGIQEAKFPPGSDPASRTALHIGRAASSCLPHQSPGTTASCAGEANRCERAGHRERLVGWEGREGQGSSRHVNKVLGASPYQVPEAARGAHHHRWAAAKEPFLLGRCQPTDNRHHTYPASGSNGLEVLANLTGRALMSWVRWCGSLRTQTGWFFSVTAGRSRPRRPCQGKPADFAQVVRDLGTLS